MNHKILMETESPELSKSLHETGEIAPKAVKTADCKSDAEWYFQQSEASREFYEVFFDTCHKYDVSWSQASPVVKELISDLVQLTLDRNAAERKLRSALSVDGMFYPE